MRPTSAKVGGQKSTRHSYGEKGQCSCFVFSSCFPSFFFKHRIGSIVDQDRVCGGLLCKRLMKRNKKKVQAEKSTTINGKKRGRRTRTDTTFHNAAPPSSHGCPPGTPKGALGAPSSSGAGWDSQTAWVSRGSSTGPVGGSVVADPVAGSAMGEKPRHKNTHPKRRAAHL